MNTLQHTRQSMYIILGYALKYNFTIKKNLLPLYVNVTEANFKQVLKIFNIVNENEIIT